MNTKKSILLAALAIGVVVPGRALAQPAQRPPRPEWPPVSTAVPSMVGEGTKDAALLIGIDGYLLLPKVPGATQNVNDWMSFLRDSRKVPFDHIHSLRDQDATRENILKRAEEAAAQVEEGGTLWFVFVGHGAPRPAAAGEAPDGVLVGVDAQQNANMYSRSVAQREIAEKLTTNNKGRVVMVVDACFSGRTADGNSLMPGAQPAIPVEPEAPAQVTLLSAGKADQFSGPLPNGRRPAFSYLVLGGMRGWADKNLDGVVTVREAIDYSREVLLREIGRRQEPTLSSGLSELPLSRGASEPGPDVDGILNPPVAAIEPDVVDRPVPWPVYVGAIGTVALLAGGAATGVIALNKRSDFKRLNDGANPSAADDVHGQVQTMNLVTDVLLGSAIVAGGLTTYLFLSRPTVSVRPSSSARIAPVVHPNLQGLVLQGNF